MPFWKEFFVTSLCALRVLPDTLVLCPCRILTGMSCVIKMVTMKRNREDLLEGTSEDQELYQLIENKDWTRALELLEPGGQRHAPSRDYLKRKLGTRRYTPFAAVLRQTKGEILEPAAIALCLRLIELGGPEMLERAWHGTALHVLLAWRRTMTLPKKR